MPPPVSSRRRPARLPIHPLGDAALHVQLGRRIDTALNSRAIALAAALRGHRGVRDVVPGYASVTVHYDPEQVTYRALGQTIGRRLEKRPELVTLGRLHRIPVVYDGPDLDEAAGTLGMSPAELIRRHAAPTYRVFMIGFVPGWAYLGPLPPELVLPRRSVPRTHVPAGSVAIAGAQTGIYPLPTPGGWHLIGNTRLPMFLPDSDPPLLFRAGDRVRFFAAEA
jgi:KipI family sensor histidine kinase inhibitor